MRTPHLHIGAIEVSAIHLDLCTQVYPRSEPPSTRGTRGFPYMAEVMTDEMEVVQTEEDGEKVQCNTYACVFACELSTIYS